MYTAQHAQTPGRAIPVWHHKSMSAALGAQLHKHQSWLPKCWAEESHERSVSAAALHSHVMVDRTLAVPKGLDSLPLLSRVVPGPKVPREK